MVIKSVVLKLTNISLFFVESSAVHISFIEVICSELSGVVIPTGWRTMVCYGWHSES